MNLRDIKSRLQSFASVRNWDQFHTPKNLSMALAAEAAELLEIFQWLTDEQSREIVHNEKEMAQIRHEIADVMIYLIRLSDKLGVDIEKAVLDRSSSTKRNTRSNWRRIMQLNTTRGNIDDY